MKGITRLFLCFFLLSPVTSFATHGAGATIFAKDSIINNRLEINKGWRFMEADSPAMALPEYDDSRWDVINAQIRYDADSKSRSRKFNSVGWFRYHFIADSSIAGLPLGLMISHYGASEIYLDGKKIDSFGVIGTRESTVGYDPHGVFVSFTVPNAGPHLLAVRYANYNAAKYYKWFHRSFAGLDVAVSDAKSAASATFYHTKYFTFINAILFGIFLALSGLHFFLYLYYRASRSNLFFSLFCISVAIGFFITTANQMSSMPAMQVADTYVAAVIMAAMPLSLSGFINSLFSSGRLIFRIVCAAAVIAPFIWLYEPFIGVICYFFIIIFVFFEAIIRTINAIINKVKGARIIGTGILFFTAFFIALLFATVFLRFSFDDSTTSGKVLFLLTGSAILSMPVSMSRYLAWSFSSVNKNLSLQLQQVEVLSEKALQQEQERKRILESQKEQLEQEVKLRTAEVVAQRDEIEKQHNELKTEKKKSDDLLRNILPEEVAEELKQNGVSKAKFFDEVTVLFTDFVDFTLAGEKMKPQELVDELHACFKAFDDIISSHGLEKIKTIGDAYLAVCGLPLADADHAARVVAAASEIVQFMQHRKRQLGDNTFEVRVGVHSGSVVAGIVGVKKFAYDIWGDTVNTAARMEQNSRPGKINISQTTYELVKNKFTCTFRGEIEAKNKGELSMYFVEEQIVYGYSVN
jgi:adenylate cyclase